MDAVDATRRACVPGRADGVWVAPDAIDGRDITHGPVGHRLELE